MAAAAAAHQGNIDGGGACARRPSVPEVTKIADRLAKRNLAARNPCADDRRVIYLELATAGAELAEELRCLVTDVVQQTYINVLGVARAAMVAEAMAELREANAA